jgi:hypothetical protein
LPLISNVGRHEITLRRPTTVSKATAVIGALVLILVGSNLWWASRVLDAGISLTYARASEETTSELLTQTLAVLPVVARTGVSREQVVAAARITKDRVEPYEKEGYVWVGQLGLKFNPQGQFEKAIAGPEAPTQ